MNVQTEVNEQGRAARRSPSVSPSEPGGGSPKTTIMASAGSGSDDDQQTAQSSNPLMRLVDAALAPSSDSEKKTDNFESEKQSKAKDDSMDTSTTSKEEAQQHQQTEKKPTLQDAKVIKGSVDDLMSNHEKKSTFAEYLMEVLNNEENHDVLQWMPCGTQFTITNHRKFTMERMPELFKIRNMSSFVRKLTRWGFSRVHEKETGNSDIFKHPNFQRDKPELCKKIRCVNRATASNSAHLHYGAVVGGHTPHSVLMGNLSESSVASRHVSEMHMLSPQRRIAPGMVGAGGGGGGIGYPPHHGRSPYTSSSAGAGGGPRPYAPRVSPEYEKEMMPGSAFRPRPGPPQVYAPSSPGGMTAAAEYELEQILLQRQQARAAAAFRQQQQQQRSSPPEAGAGGGRPLMGSGSERSMGSAGPGAASHEQRGNSSSSRGAYNGHADFVNATATSQVVTAALETLQREGEYDLDMSPREAMLRAVLHKRQQQRAAARAIGSSSGRPSPGPYGGGGGSSSSHHAHAAYHHPSEAALPPRAGPYYR